MDLNIASYTDKAFITYYLEKSLYGKENIKKSYLDRLLGNKLLCQFKLYKLQKKLSKFLDLPSKFNIQKVEIDKETKNKIFLIKTNEGLIEIIFDKYNNITVKSENERDIIREYYLKQFSYNPSLPPYETKKVDFGIIPKKTIKTIINSIELPITTITKENKIDYMVINVTCNNYSLKIRLEDSKKLGANLNFIDTTYEYNFVMKNIPFLSIEKEKILFAYLERLSLDNLAKNINFSLKKQYNVLKEVLKEYQIEVTIIKRNNERETEEYTTNGLTETITFKTDKKVTRKCVIKKDEIISFKIDENDNKLVYNSGKGDKCSFKFNGKNNSVIDTTIASTKEEFKKLLLK